MSDSRMDRRMSVDQGQPTFQVIVLGPAGGPREDNITGLLVRSASTSWTKGSVVAVDAGTMLSGIIRTLEPHMTVSEDGKASVTGGPFVGLQLPHSTAKANAAYIFREIIAAVLITHPHLDHLAGLAINTPIVEASNGPKTVAALPSVIAAMKNHMFNDVIWPNLSDEDGGAGLITYQRLVEGGNPHFGRGELRGYVRACENLLTKCLSVSHGHCKQQYHPETGRHHRVGSGVFTADSMMVPSSLSVDHSEAGRLYSPTRTRLPSVSGSSGKESAWATVESSAFFIRDGPTGNEIIVFGDIEPDSVSLEPRNRRVWEIAARKVAAGTLRAIFIECSFNDSVDDHSLYGHLCPRHLVAELKVLAERVVEAQQESPSRSRGRSSKRKRHDSDSGSPRTTRTTLPQLSGRNPNHTSEQNPHEESDDHANAIIINEEDDNQASPAPLAGLTVYIIHIKDTFSDGPHPSEQILQELRAHSEAAGLGCRFYVPKQGEGIWI